MKFADANVTPVDHREGKHAIAMRLDACPEIGYGHFFRCLALADGLRRSGANVRFIYRRLSPAVERLAAHRGHEVVQLPEIPARDSSGGHELAHSAWLPGGWENDAQLTSAALADRADWSWIVVDHYALDGRWETCVRKGGTKILAIDDLADRAHACEILLDQNIQRDGGARYRRLTDPTCRTLLGPRFALLRPEFRDRRRQMSRPSGRGVQRILLFLGTVDVGATLKCLRAIRKAALPDIHVDAVIGQPNGALAQIEEECRGFKSATCHVQVEDMAALLANADLCIGAAGSSSWERCCLGLPAMIFAFAANQVEVLEGLAASRAALSLGKIADWPEERLSDFIRRLVRRDRLLARMGRRASRLVDGCGVERVCHTMLGRDAVSIRPATQDDCVMAWRWRNDVRIRGRSFDDAEIPLESHRAWWSSKIGSASSDLLIGTVAGTAIGVLRYDFSDRVATVSIYLDPDMTGEGIGGALLETGLQWLRTRRREVKVVEAHVREDNPTSRRLFISKGFREERGRLVLDCLVN